MQSHLEQCRYNMVEQQVRPWDVLDNKVLNVLEQTPRDVFVSSQYTNLAYADTAIPLNNSQHMMHPIIEGRILQLLNIQPEDTILEIGTGSGYLTACLAQLGSHVDSLEIDSKLAQLAEQNLQQLSISNINISCADGLDMNNIKKKYDIIVLTGSVSKISKELKNTLTVNGRLFAISGTAPVMVAHLMTRKDEKNWHDETIFETVLKPLTNGEAKPDFKF
ncbi:Protein-L-isoaspartate O-methyltransferase [hydrothermal vent metagenome]|uniref:Protein-L-isoaspartate O-methyltransferase n=1 Tax=hydrothermal vent metagenome TaxID=652676 RepID=A0A3B0Y9L3_9ZZZZ